MCCLAQWASPTGPELLPPLCVGMICPVNTDAPSLIIHPLLSCAYYVPGTDGETKMKALSPSWRSLPFVKTNVLFTRDRRLLEFHSEEVLSKKKLKRDYLCRLDSLT